MQVKYLSILASLTMMITTTTAATADTLYTIPSDVSAGHMNVRTGPGTNYALLGAIPAGKTVSASRCVPRQDGIRGADWCLVTWNGPTGWVSKAGLMPVAAAPARPVTTSPVSDYSGWTTDYYPKSQMCVMAFGKFGSDVVSSTMFKWSPDIGLFMHIGKSSWSIEAGSSVPLSVVFDTGVRNGSGYVLDEQKNGSLIQIDIKEDQDGFMEDVANAKKLTITSTRVTSLRGSSR